MKDNRIRNRRGWRETNYLFYGLSLLGFFVSFALMIKTSGECFRAFFYYGHDYFMDFFNHIFYVADRTHVYESSIYASFPPLAYIFYWVLGKFIPGSAIEGPGGRGLRDNLFGFTLYTAYTVILAVFFIFLLQHFMEKRRRGEQLFLSGIILLSAPFIGLYERGNSAFAVLVLLCFFIMWKDAGRAWQRETAILCLAAAAGLKLYPAVFGLLYLREKRWKEAFRLTVYGLLMVFVPFVFFGGLKEVPVLLNNFRAISEEIKLGDLRSVTYAVVLIGQKFGVGMGALLAAGQLFSVLFLLISCVLTLLQRVLWKRLVLLSGIMILFPVWSGSYTLIYLALPLVLFIGGWKEERKETPKLLLLYQIWFACIFTMVLWNPSWSMRIFNADFPYTIRALGAWGLILTVMADTVCRRIGPFKKYYYI